MPFDDLDDAASDEPDPGDEALDGLAESLSESETDDEPAESEAEPSETSATDEAATADDDDSPAYDPEVEPAFPTAKARTQHSIYCLPTTWDDVDGTSGLLFEAEVSLRRDGYDNVQKRELHNAILRAAVETLSTEDVVETVIETRENRTDGPLLNADT